MRIFLKLLFFSYGILLKAQIPQQEFLPHSGLQYSLGMSAQVYFGKLESNYNISACFGIQYTRSAVMLSNQLFLNLYQGGVGTSVLSNSTLPFYNFSNFFLDLFLSPSATFGIGSQNIPVFVRPANFMSAPVIFHQYAVSGTIGSSFVINNKRRNQRTGSLNLNFGPLSFGYYNDNMAQIFAANGFGLGDGHDRWWTGGGFINLRLLKNYELFYEFDRFTGFGGKLFEISEMLNLNHMYYPAEDAIQSKDLTNISKNEMFFNRGITSFGIRNYNSFNSHFYFKFSFMGDPSSDVQNLIHSKLSKDPFHNTQVENSWQMSFGGQIKSK